LKAITATGFIIFVENNINKFVSLLVQVNLQGGYTINDNNLLPGKYQVRTLYNTKYPVM